MSLGEALFGSEDEATLDAEIRAELDHHLALSERRLREQGRSAEAAHSEARERFGNYDQIHGACLRAQLGRRNMWRKIHAATTIVLALTVIVMFLMARVRTARAREEAEHARHLYEAAMHTREQASPVELYLEVGDRVTLVPTFNRELAVTEEVTLDGKLLLPHAGWVFLAGLTREEAEQRVSESLKPYFARVEVKLKVERQEVGGPER